jgi:signal transduction histidine kinase
LESSQRANERLMKVVAHDLRNPVGSISMAAALLAEPENDEQAKRDFLEIIQTSAQSALHLIADLLQRNHASVQLRKETVDFETLVTSCVNMMTYKAEEKAQTILMSTQPIKISVDREKIGRVISNLLANAIKFSPSGQPITIRTQIQDDALVLSVADRGIGIPISLQSTLFDTFTASKRSGTAGEQPFGLGLSISKQIIEAHQGKIWFETAENQYTIFYIQLPL